MQELVSRRRDLVEMLTQERNRLKHVSGPMKEKSTATLSGWMNKSKKSKRKWSRR